MSVEGLSLAPIAEALYSHFYENVVLVTTDSHPESTKVNGQPAPYLPNFYEDAVLTEFYRTNQKKFFSNNTEAIVFAPFGCRGNTTYTEISPVKQAHTRVEDKWKCSDVCPL